MFVYEVVTDDEKMTFLICKLSLVYMIFFVLKYNKTCKKIDFYSWYMGGIKLTKVDRSWLLQIDARDKLQINKI